jgi:hypothetical protein
VLGAEPPEFPYLQFYEALHLSENDFQALKLLLHKLIDRLVPFYMAALRANPGIVEPYQLPNSWTKQDGKA